MIAVDGGGYHSGPSYGHVLAVKSDEASLLTVGAAVNLSEVAPPFVAACLEKPGAVALPEEEFLETRPG